MRRLARNRPARAQRVDDKGRRVVRWDTAPSTPIEDIARGLAIAARMVDREPTVLVLGPSAYGALEAWHEKKRKRRERRERRRRRLRLWRKRGRR